MKHTILDNFSMKYTKLNCILLFFFIVLFLSCNNLIQKTDNKAVYSVDNIDEFKVITWNILHGEADITNRIKELIKLLKKTDADIITLQEVDNLLFNTITNDSIINNKYNFKIKLENNRPVGELLILSKFKIDSSYYLKLPKTRMGRYVLFNIVVINNQKFTIATSHLESRLTDNIVRAEQLDLIFANLRNKTNAIFTADFNFGDFEYPETSYFDTNFIDVWKEIHNNKNGYTWNIEYNVLANRNSYVGEPSRRLDRVLFKSNYIKSKYINIIANEPVLINKEIIFLSDHLTGMDILFLI